MMTVSVLSSMFGGYDHIAPPLPQTVDARWIMVTDEPKVDGWEVVNESRPNTNPRLAAKVAKCIPFDYADTDVTVWMDAACRFTRPDSLERILAGAPGDIAQIVHPERDCIYAEAAHTLTYHKYQGQPVAAQIDHYRALGHPEHAGLWAGGLIVRRDTPAVREFGCRWLAEQVRWSHQDQLSEVPVARSMGIEIGTLPFPLQGSGVIDWIPHRRFT
jgi:hypothetical protein